MSPGSIVWCNVGDNDPDKIRTWGARYVFGYVNTGAWEAWYTGATGWQDENSECLGEAYPGWEGERFLDIRDSRVVDYVRTKIKHIKEAGFDGVDFDNLDLDQHQTGWNIESGDELKYVSRLFRRCRKLGLLVSFRHMTRPDLLTVKPDLWLVETQLEDEGWRRFMQPETGIIDLEYGVKMPKPGDFPGWIILCNRELSENINRRILI
ncbi:MAG: endo alpha-1,4 polygalactosaminidase [Saezia sp.]